MSKAYEEYLKKEKLSKEFAKQVANVIGQYLDEHAGNIMEPFGNEYYADKARKQYFGQALIHEKNEEYEKALELFELAGNQGHGEACYKAAMYYFDGKGTLENPTKGFEWLEKSVKNYYFAASTELAKCYLYGNGTRIDIPKAIEILEIATFVDDEGAIEYLADLYENGLYVQRDLELSDYLRNKIYPEGEA